MPVNQTQLKAYISLARLDKPVGIYLVLWPALWALWLAADGWPGWHLLLVFVFGAMIMRSAGCVINDYADRDFDGHVARTCQRPIASGVISAKSALVFFMILLLAALLLVFSLNISTVFWSLGAVFLAVLYPFMKRHTYWPQAFLGASFAWAIPLAFVAVTDSSPPASAWLLFAITLIWALIYDTAYAIGDKEDDLKIGVKSTAILFADKTNFIIAGFQLLMLGLLLLVWQIFSLGWFSALSIFIVMLLFIYHQILLAKQDAKLAFKVFLNNHWVGFVLWLGVVADTSL
ncbi:MAG TPA: 4-hydroxybenzoate octaprenyltransferase [Thiomicrospira sp.]|jgi:4-hydroxybenzoate polyprenyltransferase|nr:4-hydroxybenzoate octaprenyltransferase [Thiomicrospira sp.]